MTIIARCDKYANTECIARDCLCVYAYARMALAIMPTSHAKVIIRSHCYVIMTAVFRAKLVTIYVDWITLLRRLLKGNTTAIFNKNMLESMSIQIFPTYCFCCMVSLIIKITSVGIHFLCETTDQTQ